VHMDTSAPFIFRILKILKFHISMSPKITVVKYINRYLQEECMQNNPIKNMLYSRKYKKDKFLIVNYTKVVEK
jgi:hypothetical protein